MNDGEKGLMQMYVNNGYELFLTRCSDGRGISMEELDKIAPVSYTHLSCIHSLFRLPPSNPGSACCPTRMMKG